LGSLALSTACGSLSPLDFCLHLPPPLLLLPISTWPWLGICMSAAPGRDGEIELTCTWGDLRISISGPASQATDLLRFITSRDQPLPVVASSAASDSSYTVVTEPPLATVTVPAPKAAAQPAAPLETRDQIAATFPSCPAAWLQGWQKLTGSRLTGEERLQRAWRAGQWAKAVADGRVPTPNRSVPLDIKSRYYSVLSAPGLGSPTVFNSAGSYWSAVGELSTSPSISHAFPSQTEARVYLAGAGVINFEVLP